MRAARPVSVLLLIWPVIGAVAAGQRHYYTEGSETCAGAGTIIVTILAGPLNLPRREPESVLPPAAAQPIASRHRLLGRRDRLPPQPPAPEYHVPPGVGTQSQAVTQPRY
jgi:hypothetical protein